MVAKILSKSKESRLDGLLWAERDAVRGRGTSRRCSRVRPAAAAPLLAPALRASSGSGCCKSGACIYLMKSTTSCLLHILKHPHDTQVWPFKTKRA